MTRTPAEPQRGTRTPARPRPPLRPSSQGSRWPAVAGCGGGSSGGGTFSPGRGVSAVVTGGIAVCGGTGAPGSAPSAPGRRARPCVAPSTWGNTAASEAPLSWSLRSRLAAAHARSPHARPVGLVCTLLPSGEGPPGTASEWLAHLADPLSGRPVSTWQELGRWKVPEAAASQGSAGRQEEASLEQPRAPRAGSAGQTPVPVGSRGASPARGRGCGIVTHGGGRAHELGGNCPFCACFRLEGDAIGWPPALRPTPTPSPQPWACQGRTPAWQLPPAPRHPWAVSASGAGAAAMGAGPSPAEEDAGVRAAFRAALKVTFT